LNVYQDIQNQYGCPIRFQSGPQGITNFEAIISRLEPEQRAAFENERAERQAELDEYVEAYGYQT
jgi:hypothetical protein